MKIVSIKCPECKANLNIDLSQINGFGFCQYCGSKIYVDDKDPELERLKVKQEHELNMERLKTKYRPNNESMDALIGIIAAVIVIIVVVGLMLVIANALS